MFDLTHKTRILKLQKIKQDSVAKTHLVIGGFFVYYVIFENTIN